MEQRSASLICASDAGNLLGYTPQHVRLLARNGHLNGQKLGRDWFFSRPEIETYLEVRKNSRATMEVRESALQYDLGLPDLPQALVNVASVPQRSPFRYPGGKTWLIPVARRWLSSLEKSPQLLIEPFAGGAGIGLMSAFENFTTRTTLIELDIDIVCVWKVILEGNAEELCERIRMFKCNAEEVHRELETEPQTTVDQAFHVILRNRVSRGGILAPGAGFVKTGEGNRGISSRWYPETLIKRIREIVGVRDRLAVTHGDGLEAIRQGKDDSATAFFIDPPYPVAGRRLYRHHALDHRELLRLVSEIQGPVLVTYDENMEIAELARNLGLETALIPMKSTHHLRKNELLIGKSLAWLA